MRNFIIIIVAIECFLVAVYRITEAEMMFYFSLLFGMLVVGFSWNARCPVCKEQQVFRGLSIADVRLPGKKCYACGSELRSFKIGD